MATFDKSNSNGRFTLRLILEEGTYSIANNTSPLDYKLVLIANTSYHFSDYKIGYTVKVKGKTVASRARADSASLSIASNGTLTLCSGTYTVTHNNDGSLEDMPVAFSIDMASADYTPGSLSGSGKMDLTVIPRASTIGATAANIGEVSAITVNRKANSYTHSIAYKFGSLSGYIADDGSVVSSETKITATSIAFAVPTDFYAQIPNAKSGKCTLTIKTYSGSTQIGDAQTCTFTATAAQADCAPTLSATAADINTEAVALTGSSGNVLQGISDVQVVSTAKALNGATISSIKVVCGSSTLTGEDVTFEGADSGTIKITAKDSRGYTTTVTLDLTLVEYYAPTVAMTVQRETQTSDKVKVSVKGTWFHGDIGSTSNVLTATVQYRVLTSGSEYSSKQTITLTTDGDSYSGSVDITGLDYQLSYYFRAYVNDAVCVSGGIEEPVTATASLAKGIPIWDHGEDDFAFNVPLYVEGLNVSGLLKAMTSSYTLGTTATAGTNWTVNSAAAMLCGTNLRVAFNATRNSAAEGDIANETLCTLKIATGGKIKSALSVGACSAGAGGVATFNAAASLSGETLTITITLAATGTATTTTNAYFVVPCLLNLDAY